jgi:4-carboxymuconolactone decarboxylase
MAQSERLSRALAILNQLEPGAPERVLANLDSVSENLAEIVLGFAFADVVSRPAIDLKTREMLTVAALTAMGTAPGQLEFHMRAALNVGVTREEIIEIVLQMAVYAGVPACMNGVAAARQAFTRADAAAVAE